MCLQAGEMRSKDWCLVGSAISNMQLCIVMYNVRLMPCGHFITLPLVFLAFLRKAVSQELSSVRHICFKINILNS